MKCNTSLVFPANPETDGTSWEIEKNGKWFLHSTKYFWYVEIMCKADNGGGDTCVSQRLQQYRLPKAPFYFPFPQAEHHHQDSK